MNKILLSGKEITSEELKKLFNKLFCATDIETADNIPNGLDGSLFICTDAIKTDTKIKLEKLGYKTVLVAYTDRAVNQSFGNSDLEKHGYKFEDGV